MASNTLATLNSTCGNVLLTTSTTSSNWNNVVSYGNRYTFTNGSNHEYYDFESKVLDIEKLSKLDKTKRKMLFKLFTEFIKAENYNNSKIMYNTLESYNLIIEKNALNRKIKISNLKNINNNSDENNR
jgi:hypothetical protein